MKLLMVEPHPQHHTLWAATRLVLVLMCLPILPACGPSTPLPATVSDTAGKGPVAFVYTTCTCSPSSSTGTDGLVGASAQDGSAVWRAAVGHANGAPILVGDTLYVCVVGQGRATQDIVAVRVATGQLLWRTKLPAGSLSDVINADTTTVVVDAGDNGLYALNSQNGTTRWHLPLFVEQKPLVHAGVVYALVDPQRFSLQPSLNAYRASDGKLLWSVPQGRHKGRIELNSSAIFEDVGTLQTAGFSLRDGHQLWTSEGGFLVAATDAAVFIQDGDYHLDALSATDGSRLWQTSISPGLYSSDFDVAPVANSALYVTGSSSSSGDIAAVRTRDGTVLWQHTNLNVEAVIVVNGVAYLYTSGSPSECLLGPCTGQVVAQSAATGALLWQKSVPNGQLLAEPVASDEVGGQ